MSATDSSPYIDIEALKSFLGFKDDDSSNDILLSIIFNTTHHIDTILTPYTDTPIPTGSLWEETKYVAMQYALSLYYQRLYQTAQAKSYQEIYNERKEDLLKAYMARKTSQTASSFVAPPDLLRERIYQPTEIDNFIVREF